MNKVKPFYIRITGDMTAQIIQDALDKCVMCGCCAHEGLGEAETKIRYQYPCYMRWAYFGVDSDGDTLFSNDIIDYSDTAEEITLDQLDEWLGIGPDADEWNGESLPPVGVECEILFKEYPQKGFGLFKILSYHYGYVWLQYIGPLENKGKCYTSECSLLEFRKPETPQQKAERERMDAAYGIYCAWASEGELAKWSRSDFEKSPRVKSWLATVDLTGYRKK